MDTPKYFLFFDGSANPSLRSCINWGELSHYSCKPPSHLANAQQVPSKQHHICRLNTMKPVQSQFLLASGNQTCQLNADFPDHSPSQEPIIFLPQKTRFNQFNKKDMGVKNPSIFSWISRGFFSAIFYGTSADNGGDEPRHQAELMCSIRIIQYSCDRALESSPVYGRRCGCTAAIRRG